MATRPSFPVAEYATDLHTGMISSMDTDRLTMFTVGHSTHSPEVFLGLLTPHDVDIVVDVRSRPSSAYNPQFNRAVFSSWLAPAQVRYVWMGDELGGKPSDSRFYDDEGHVRYDLIADDPLFRAGVRRLLGVAAKCRVAIVCSEEDPSECHRFLLVARVLTQHHDVTCLHIRGDGSILTSDQVPSYDAWNVPVWAQQSLLGSSVPSSSWRSAHRVRQP